MPSFIENENGNKPLSFQGMLDAIRREFSRPDNRVDIDELWRVLERYKSNPKDWSKYAFYDEKRYKRNLVDDHEMYNVMILCWAPGVSSSIHDHSGSHCFMKVLDGELVESRYSWPLDHFVEDNNLNTKRVSKQMDLMSRHVIENNNVAYIHDKVGLHRIDNNKFDQTAASLHIYIPPFRKCKTFDLSTGQSQECKLSFYSERGRVIKMDEHETC